MSELFNWDRAVRIADPGPIIRALDKVVERCAVEGADYARDRDRCPVLTGTLQKSLAAREHWEHPTYEGRAVPIVSGEKLSFRPMERAIASALPYCRRQEYTNPNGKDHFIHKAIKHMEPKLKAMTAATLRAIFDEQWQGGVSIHDLGDLGT